MDDSWQIPIYSLSKTDVLWWLMHIWLDPSTAHPDGCSAQDDGGGRMRVGRVTGGRVAGMGFILG